MNIHEESLPVLEYLQRQIDGTLNARQTTHMRYPTAISRTLAIRVVEVAAGHAPLEIDADAEIHGNQQGTVHGGLLCELADAAIGTAHSTLRAVVRPVQTGKTLTHYVCDILREDGKQAAMIVSTVMTLRGDQAHGR